MANVCVQQTEGLERAHPAQHTSPVASSTWQWLTACNPPISVSLSKFRMKNSVSDYHGVNPPTLKNLLINFLISVNVNNGKIQAGLSSHRHENVTLCLFFDFWLKDGWLSLPQSAKFLTCSNRLFLQVWNIWWDKVKEKNLSLKPRASFY